LKEIWRKIPFHDAYDISNYGRLRSYKNNRHGGLKNPKILEGTIQLRGYRQYFLDKKPILAHRLVLMAFKGLPPTPQHEACHNDGKTTNNHIENLRWDTHANNLLDRVKHGTIIKGEQHKTSVLTNKIVLISRSLFKRGMKKKAIAKLFNIKETTMGHAINRRTWNHI